MTLRGRLRRIMPYVIAGASGFLLAYLLVAVFVFPSGVLPDDIKVPNVVGLSYPDAVKALESRGLKGNRGEARFHNAAPRGTVLEQDPPPDATETPGARIMLIMSAGQRIAMIPGVIGLSRERALFELEQAGFEAGEVTERASNEPRGAVIDSRPRPGSQAAVPSTVALVISAGPTTIIVPDVVGRPVSDATQLLRQVGLAVGEISYAGGGSAITDAAAVVSSQTPPAGSQAAAGSRVTMVVGGRSP